MARPGLLAFNQEAVANPRFCQDVPGPCRIEFELLTQLADEDAKMLLLPAAIDSQDGFENRTMRDDPPRVRREDGQQLEFFRSEPDFRPCTVNAVSVEIDGEVTIFGPPLHLLFAPYRSA